MEHITVFQLTFNKNVKKKTTITLKADNCEGTACKLTTHNMVNIGTTLYSYNM